VTLCFVIISRLSCARLGNHETRSSEHQSLT